MGEDQGDVGLLTLQVGLLTVVAREKGQLRGNGTVVQRILTFSKEDGK